MAHQHSIYDTDPHFKIDGFTMAITDQSEKPTRLMKDDHNSQRITFEIDRYLDGHDVLTCNRIEVHFINIDAATKETNADVYKVEDVSESPDSDKVAIFSWLVSKAATKYAGTLNFRIRFACIDENGVEQYAKHTDTFKGMLVGDGYNNAETVVNNYSDILTEWETKFINLINANALTVANTTESTADGGENVVTFSDGSRLIVKNGRQGTPGTPGKDGNDYILTEDDKEEIVARVVHEIRTGGVTGYIDENKVLWLSGIIPKDTYTTKFIDETGDTFDIGKLELVEKIAIVNQIPLSTDTDGNLYNGGQGWKTGYRISGSSGSESAQDDTEVTGFIPVKYGDTVYMQDITDDGTHVIGIYTSAHAMLITANFTAVFGGAVNGGVVSFKVDTTFGNGTLTENSGATYLRVSATEITNNSIITVNQPIE